MFLKSGAVREVVSSALLCLVLAVAASFPLVLSPTSRLIGHGDVDATNHAWGPWWWWWTLGRGELPWSTTLLAAPKGGLLWFIDPFTAAVGAPLVGIVGPVGAYNLAVLVSLAVGACGARQLAVAVGAGRGTAWFAAAAAVFSPYVLSELHNGVSEAVNVGWASFTLAAARRAIDAGAGPGVLRRWLPVGLLLGLTAAGTWYYALATGVTIGGWVLLEAVGGGRAGLGRLRAVPLGGGLLAAAVALVTAAPVFALVRASIADERSLVMRGDVDPAVRLFLQAHNAVDPRAFFAPLGFQSVDLASQGEAFLHSGYLGLVLGGLAGLAAWRGEAAARRTLLGIVPAALLSLGAYLWWDGAWVRAGQALIELPFAWLTRILPDAGATHAQRLIWPACVVVAALAARGLTLLPGKARFALGGLALADLLLASPWPLARMAALDTDAHVHLRRVAASLPPTDPRGVIDLPAEVGNTMATSVYLMYQSASRLPIPYRPDARGGTASTLGVPAFNILFAPSASRAAEVERLAWERERLSSVELGALESRGFRWIVLHQEFERGRGDIVLIQAQLEEWFGAGESFGTHLVYDIRKRKADEVPLPKVDEHPK